MRHIMIIVLLVVTWGDSIVCAQVGGGGGPIPDKVIEHNHSLLTAFMGNTEDWHATIEIEEEWESRLHYEMDTTLGGFGSDLSAAEREFGAFTVTNWNNTDSDTIIDCDDNLISSQFDTRNEVDLFKVILKLPAAAPDGWNAKSVAWLDLTGPNGSDEHNMELYTDATKATKFLKREFLGTQYPACKTFEFWVEVRTGSAEMSDRSITFTHDPDPLSPVNKEADIIDVTGIWAEMERCRPVTDYYSIVKRIGLHKFELSPPAAQPGTAIEEEDWLVFFDDNHAPNGFINDTANISAHARVTEVNPLANGNVEVTVTTEHSGGNPPAALPADYDVQDIVGFGLSPGVDSLLMLDTFMSPTGSAGTIGSARCAPSCQWAIEFTWLAKPDGIAKRPLSHGERAIFDITRQVVARAAYRIPVMQGEGVPVRYPKLELIQWPAQDELPNDDTTYTLNPVSWFQTSGDSDCIPGRSPVYGGGYFGLAKDFDPLYSIDAPGVHAFKTINTNQHIMRLNGLEFVRVCIREGDDENNIEIPGDEVFGSRCSYKHE